MKNEDDEVEKFVMANTQGSNSIGQLMHCFITMIPIFLVASFKPKYFPTEFTHLAGAWEGQVALPAVGQEVQGARLCPQAHLQQARREDRGGQERGELFI